MGSGEERVQISRKTRERSALYPNMGVKGLGFSF